MRSQADLIDLKYINKPSVRLKSVLRAGQLLRWWHRAPEPHLAFKEDNLGVETESRKILLKS